jgi:hypothetical protein
MPEKIVAAGASPPEDAVGLTGLVPFVILSLPEQALQSARGLLRLSVELPPGRALDPTRPIRYRIYGGEAGIDVASPGRIVSHFDSGFPLEVPYEQRIYPTPPPRGQVVVDLSFWHTNGTDSAAQDVQWRQPIVWQSGGGTVLDLRFTLAAAG